MSESGSPFKAVHGSGPDMMTCQLSHVRDKGEKGTRAGKAVIVRPCHHVAPIYCTCRDCRMDLSRGEGSHKAKP